MARTTKDNRKQIKLAIKWYGLENVEESLMEFIRVYGATWRKTRHGKY
jgi:hypothetical protein